MLRFYWKYLRFSFFLFLILIVTISVLRMSQFRIVPLSHAAPPSALNGNSATPPEILTNHNSERYIYFTDVELTRFNEYIYFFTGDSVIAPYGVSLHSNDDIAVHYAYFGCLVTTTGIIIDAGTATFIGGYPLPYIEHVRRVTMPTYASDLRSAAQNSGCLYSGTGYTYGLAITDTLGYLWRWQTGLFSTMDDTTQIFDTIRWSRSLPYAIFCTGDLWLKGVFSGKLGIGASGSIRLLDDIRSTDSYASNNWFPPSNSNNYLTLISEASELTSQQHSDPWKGIIIANTTANGRENGLNAAPADLTRHSIVITAQVIALNGSFTFEQQNDTWEPFQTTSTTVDNRGTIHLRGNLIQHRRGYVHRANHGGTGYLRDYRYDNRFLHNTPPFSLTFTSQ